MFRFFEKAKNKIDIALFRTGRRTSKPLVALRKGENMALFNETFTIVNNTGYTLALDKVGSQNLGDGNWPASVAAHSTAGNITQSGSFSVNPTAVYQLQGASPANTAYLHFYCAGLDPFLHVNMTLKFSGSVVPGSSISENNSLHTQTNSTTLVISTTDDGSSQGSATFTIGS